MKTLATLFALSFALALAGCNTVQGAGKDIQKAGSAVEGAAAKKKDY
jgi:predicted small secreted protein